MSGRLLRYDNDNETLRYETLRYENENDNGDVNVNEKGNKSCEKFWDFGIYS